VHATPFTPTGDEIRWSEMHGDTGGRDRADVAVPPARVYLHGLGWTSAAVFAHIVAQPALAGRRSLLIDLPGHGLSDRPAKFGYTLDDHAAAVAALLDAEQLQGVDLVGHSMGGSIGIVLAARRPDLVARLVVAEANLDPLPPSATGLGSQQISSYTEAAWVSEAFATFVAANPGWAPTLGRCDPLAIHRTAVGLIAGTRPTMRELLVSLSIPRTFIRGQHGEALRGRAVLEAAGVRIVELFDAGHMMMLDQPDMFVSTLANALA
jgi:pimeloyl-ACP methyl ester carboxylesterase